jgi:diketogulonate reductase-like aldo/keto reductase
MMKLHPLGFGTFRLQDEIALQSVKYALESGYRHIDTAQVYENEGDVGRAIVESNIARSEVFITTKVWNDNLSEDKFIDSVRLSLSKLKTDYVDLLLIHWPAPPEGISLEQALVSLYKAKQLGLAKNIGVSNFNIAQLKQALSVLPTGSIFTNQIEIHPYLQNHKVVDFCKTHNIGVTAYMPFAVGKVLVDKKINDIAKKHVCEPSEIVIAWLKQRNLAAIPSSTKKKNMLSNMKGLQISLDQEDMNELTSLDCNDRQASPNFSPIWD